MICSKNHTKLTYTEYFLKKPYFPRLPIIKTENIHCDTTTELPIKQTETYQQTRETPVNSKTTQCYSGTSKINIVYNNRNGSHITTRKLINLVIASR